MYIRLNAQLLFFTMHLEKYHFIIVLFKYKTYKQVSTLNAPYWVAVYKVMIMSYVKHVIRHTFVHNNLWYTGIQKIFKLFKKNIIF
jgi:hypothetical protein